MKFLKNIYSHKQNDKSSDYFIGFVDEFNNGTITGWSCTKDFKKTEVNLYIDGNFVSKKQANIHRPDLRSIKVGNGDHGYEFQVPKKYMGQKELKVKVVAEYKKLTGELGSKVFNIHKSEKNINAVKLGSIDRFVSNKVHGWLGSLNEDVYPYVTANGKPCEIEVYGIERKDVQGKTGLTANTGFVARLPECKYENIDFKLHAITLQGIELIDQKTIRGGSLVPDSISAVFDALEISNQKDSVGIVVWEGTHNPIGRAQVLYNVLKAHRPTIIISFNIGFSDKPVWQPLLNSDCKVLMLPWKDREMYAKLFREIGLNFDLVWVCKPRYPALVLAEYISHENTRYIVDLDDNELEMSSSKAAEEKPYGLLSAKMAQRYIDQLPVRSVASKTLQDDFGGELIRHARQFNTVKRVRATDLASEIRVGFIGTVRPHKGVVEAAKAIKALNERKGYKIKFVVGGIYDPASIRSELIALGCEVHGEIDSSRLEYHLQNMDVVITGFPDSNANKEILRYQISSKIGDGLSNERPVLVPEGASVNDLNNVPGVYLFNGINFERMLEKAIAHSEPVTLDQQFSLPWNYEQFLKLEAQAYSSSPTGKQLFRRHTEPKLVVSPERKKVVLVWKQHDTGLYGRRVDHIARLFAANDIEVTCLEIISPEQFARYEKESVRIDSDFRYIIDDYRQKREGHREDGIFYKSISIDHTQDTDSGLKRFLLEKKIYPTNSMVILFPAVPDWKTVTKVFNGYPIICDVVDNQLGWEKKQPLALLQQYKYLMDISQCVIFNSEENRKFFERAGFLKGLDVKVIPNWYSLPLGYKPKLQVNTVTSSDKSAKPVIDIVYSGNMNDRFDWDTVARIPKEVDVPVMIHLIGNCQRALDKMAYILDDPSIIYHGPMREADLLEFLKRCDLAIMPHVRDEHSGFMNPMKVNMYQAIGLPCVASAMPGVDFKGLHIFESHSSDVFICNISKFIKSFNRVSQSYVAATEENGDSSLIYLLFINGFFNGR